jgi:hypothetical protein
MQQEDDKHNFIFFFYFVYEVGYLSKVTSEIDERGARFANEAGSSSMLTNNSFSFSMISGDCCNSFVLFEFSEPLSSCSGI